MRIKRLILDNKIRYKVEDYRQLNEYYQQKIQQIHIVGEYANMMMRSYQEALQFVNDYFQMDYKKFLAQYFAGERATEIQRNISPQNTIGCLTHCLSRSWKSSGTMRPSILSYPQDLEAENTGTCT